MKFSKKHILSISLVFVFVVLFVPCVNAIAYYQNVFCSFEYKYDSRTGLDVEKLVLETRRDFSDFWFKNLEYQTAINDILNNSIYADKIKTGDKPLVSELLISKTEESKFELTPEILHKLSGELICLSKSEAFSLLTSGDAAKTLGRICIKTKELESVAAYDEQMKSIDVVLINDRIYAITTFNTLNESVSVYWLDMFTDTLITDKAFAPYWELIEKNNITKFDTFVRTALFEGLSFIQVFCIEYILTSLLVAAGCALGFVIKSAKYQSHKAVDSSKPKK